MPSPLPTKYGRYKCASLSEEKYQELVYDYGEKNVEKYLEKADDWAVPWLPIRPTSLSPPKKPNSDGRTVSPATRSGMPLAHTFMRMARRSEEHTSELQSR